MTPRSRKPVMITMFGNLDQKYQANISQLLEESEEVLNENESQVEAPPQLVTEEVPISLDGANDNGLPSVAENGSSNSSGSLSSAFK
jgi:hypothetical protein